MPYEYFTNLNIQHIDKNEINKEIDIPEFRCGIEFCKKLENSLSIKLDSILTFSDNQNLFDSIEFDTSIYSGIAFHNEIDFSKFCRILEFSKNFINSEIITSDFLVKSVSNLKLKDIITLTYAGLTELSLSKSKNLIPFIELDNFIKSVKTFELMDISKLLIEEYIIKDATFYDKLTLDYMGITTLSLSKINVFSPDFLLSHDLSIEKSSTLSDISILAISIPIFENLMFQIKSIFDYNILNLDIMISEYSQIINNYFKILKTKTLIESQSFEIDYQIKKILSFSDNYNLLNYLFSLSEFSLLKTFTFEHVIPVTTLLTTSHFDLSPHFILLFPKFYRIKKFDTEIIKILFDTKISNI